MLTLSLNWQKPARLAGTMTAVTPVAVLRAITAFFDEALSQPDLRHRILSAAHRWPPSPDPAALQALSLLSKALDSSAATSPARPSPSALRATEKLLLSIPKRSPLSVLLFSLIHALRRRPAAAALALLDLFALDPALARDDVAPSVFEDLFLPHLLPVLHWFADQRFRILSSDSPSPSLAAAAVEDDGCSVDTAAAVSLLSRMSGGQAAELKKLEKGYEDVLDANSRVYAEYLREVLESADGGRQARGPPQLILRRFDGEGGEVGEGLEEEEECQEAIGLSSGQGRYNVMHFFFFLVFLHKYSIILFLFSKKKFSLFFS